MLTWVKNVKQKSLTKLEPNLTNVYKNVLYLCEMSKIGAPISLHFNDSLCFQNYFTSLQRDGD